MCRSCYRGHRYCSDACRQTARSESVRRARALYQGTKEGRDGHRERQNDYRHGSRKNVTDQTPRRAGEHANLPARANSKPAENPIDVLQKAVAQAIRAGASRPTPSGDRARCCRCGRAGQVAWRVAPGLSVLRHGRRVATEQVTKPDEANSQATG